MKSWDGDMCSKVVRNLALLLSYISLTSAGYGNVSFSCGYLSQKVGDFANLPILGSILPEIKLPFVRLLSDGPYLWIENPVFDEDNDGPTFIRGLSGGDAGSIRKGTREAIRLLTGQFDHETRYVNKLDEREIRDPRGTNFYARPLIIRGQVKQFGINSEDLNTHSGGDYAVLPFGRTIYSVHAFGIFPPPTKGIPTVS